MAPTAEDEARPGPAAAADDGEDDYMNMVIEEPNKKETPLQKMQREKRERIERSQNQKTKREREEEAEQAREAALNKAIDSTNKGFKMLAKMGFKQGEKLGKGEYGVAEPIKLQMKEGREGVGMESDKKRKLREAYEEHAKKAKVEKETEEEYFQAMAQERKNKRMEGQFIGAQKVAEKLDTEADEDVGEDDTPKQPAVPADDRSKPLKSIPLIWRGLVRFRLEKESEGLMRKALETRSSRLPTYDDPDEDEDDQRGLGKDDKSKMVVHEDLTEEDTELEEFDALEPSEKLEKAVKYLRDKHNYCFWCKFKYPDKEMEGCPGITEEDHD
ncbi:hypothetical protein GTA08_BOTSDO02432 [Botryosphaeria dothidea]|uniref:G-patch domain-containing protein n=1 Tax=Botryosphaeria dothidea TaxID=55169 RepID=A0A8H4IYY5_9PEZI|nr:hypothetical protein GTA08_BOTSDO02432 [Botryosphaeria dothidea]